MQNAQDIKVLLLKEDSLSLQVITDNFFLFLNGFGLSIDFLKYNLEKVHLAVGQRPHFFDILLEACLVRRRLKVLNDSFVVLELLFLKLSLDLLWIEELE